MRASVLHLVLAEVVGVEALEPLVQALAVDLVVRDVDRLGVVDDVLLDQDWRPGAQRQGDGVAGPGVDGDRGRPACRGG